ncbi:MAG: cytochrome c family protein [Acidobacteriia bacterium]|nr:cytochrome c family protein [Terriglobia bacterium]
MLRNGTSAMILAVAASTAAATASSRSAPVQPIPFSHRLHAGTNGIGCLSCHTYAEHSPIAGIPSMARCFGCHKFVAKDKPDVKAVVDAYHEGRALEWARVYRLPDHVFFSHQKHVAAGLACQKCHGEVQQMDAVRLAQPLLMGWCLDCHTERHAPTTCLTCHK